MIVSSDTFAERILEEVSRIIFSLPFNACTVREKRSKETKENDNIDSKILPFCILITVNKNILICQEKIDNLYLVYYNSNLKKRLDEAASLTTRGVGLLLVKDGMRVLLAPFRMQPLQILKIQTLILQTKELLRKPIIALR